MAYKHILIAVDLSPESKVSGRESRFYGASL